MSDGKDPDSRRAALIGLVIALLLVALGFYLTRELAGAAKVQDCVMSGRTNCAPIDTTQFERGDQAGDQAGDQIAQPAAATDENRAPAAGAYDSARPDATDARSRARRQR